jgi:hypothetical protein
MRSIAVTLLCACLAVAASRVPRAWADDGVVLPLPAEDEKEIVKHLGTGVVGKALPSKTIDDPSEYFPLQERDLAYRITAGKEAGTTQTLHIQKGKRPNGNPAWRFGLTPSLDGYIQQTGDGNLMMPAVSDTDEGVIIITTPANPFVLKGMKPGESRPLTQTVVVNYLDEPTKTDYSGNLTGDYTYIGTYQVTVPAGTYNAILTRLKYHGKVGPAETEDTAYYFFAPDVGVVALINQEDVEAFWIIHIDTTTGKVLGSK